VGHLLLTLAGALYARSRFLIRRSAPRVARSISSAVNAQKLVVYHRRAGGQSQHSALLELEPKSDRIQNALAFAKQNLHTDLSVEQLAEAARLSPRQFSRAFRAETGQSLAKAIESLRLEAARQMMEQTRYSIDEVAQETGFADRRPCVRPSYASSVSPLRPSSETPAPKRWSKRARNCSKIWMRDNADSRLHQESVRGCKKPLQ
jgi:AraC-like DNA-binding protein